MVFVMSRNACVMLKDRKQHSVMNNIHHCCCQSSLPGGNDAAPCGRVQLTIHSVLPETHLHDAGCGIKGVRHCPLLPLPYFPTMVLQGFPALLCSGS
jgi:hypothetical protein